ncbi:hypothetical protein HU144_12655 [Brevibacterium sp. UCMA 11752]|nr:hypothetical protein [Brevibacterium sp. UCMA 11752]
MVQSYVAVDLGVGVDNYGDMSRTQDPIEPDYVIDSTKRTPTEKARSAATRAYGAASSSVRNAREATSGSRLIETTEANVKKALGNVSHAIDDAVRSGKVERAFDKAQETVTTGADGMRRLVTRKSK